MAITYAGDSGKLTVFISGEVDHHSAGELMHGVQQVLESKMPERVYLDLSGVTFMDSSGIAVLLRVYRAAEQAGERLVVCKVPEQAGKVLRAAGLQRLIPFE